jgi:hypothetical protein
MGTPRSLQRVSPGDGMNTGPVLALEPLSATLSGNYRYLQHPQTLDMSTLFLGDSAQEALQDCPWSGALTVCSGLASGIGDGLARGTAGSL